MSCDREAIPGHSQGRCAIVLIVFANIKMDITLNFKHKVAAGEVLLPASKSISNRVLIINALAGSEYAVDNLAVCDDTRSMVGVLNSDGADFDIGHAGTAMRFLTAFLARIAGEWKLTGSERMKQRPVGVLVEALNRLGARIEYLEKEGFPPLKIYGTTCLVGGEIEIPASVSSQYISAIMMIAPYMEKGLVIRLKGKIVSGAYLDMTLRLMRDFGVDAVREGAVIRIPPGNYSPRPFRVESDWSAASYFYECLAIAGEGEIKLKGLFRNSLQGDSRQIKVWERLGVITRFTEEGIVLTPGPRSADRLEEDFIGMPDLVQSFAVACCLMDLPFVFKGTDTLRIKETDRVEALMNELAKMGFRLEERADDHALVWEGKKESIAEVPCISTYHDHRMAMAFAPAALKFPDLVITDKEVVTKSFPGYWEEIGRLFMS